MSKPKILVVEDERVVAADIEECLRKLGYVVVGAAASGVGAIRRAVETSPDLVLMDIKLKGAMDGVDAADELHSRLGIPVVFLTAYADGEILERAKKSSPFGYVLKPFDERALRSAVEIALYRHPEEQKLAENERRLITALRSFGQAVILTESEGLITFMNRAAERLTGWKQSDAIGKRIGDVFVTLRSRTGSMLSDPVARTLREGTSLALGEGATLVSKHGAETWIQGSATPLWDEDREIVGAALVFHRMSSTEGEEPEYPKPISAGSRTETLGQLAGAITEDFSEAFSTIKALVSRLRNSSEVGDAARGELEDVLDAADKGGQLAERMLAFAQHRHRRPMAVRVAHLAEGMRQLLTCAAGSDTEVQTVLHPDTGSVHADPDKLEELILDLVLESRRKTPSGGKITLETGNVELLGEYARARTSLQPGTYVLLRVSYAGSVMLSVEEDPQREAPSVCELVRELGGDIALYSEPGRVTTFEVYLPRVEEKPSTEAAA